MRILFVLMTIALQLHAFPETGSTEIIKQQRKSTKSEKSAKTGRKFKAQASSGDVRSKVLLKELSKHYRSMKSMEAQVSVEMEGGASQSKETRKGRLLLRGRKFRIDMGEQLIISDGRISWTYLKEMNEVSISHYEPTPDQITPDNLFTLYEKGFDSFMEAENGGDKNGIAQIDLVPQNKSVSYFKVRITVNKSSRLIQRAIVFDKSGVQYTYSITGFKANPRLKDDLFSFNPKAYPGVEVVDMR
ncbi:MAG: outer membrane lipoprotein carrier protein LolA [Sphingomonadales bacterium]|nr:outer membrane lipoprotein carrier protein LolA [Sphingomonadales bacterium]